MDKVVYALPVLGCAAMMGAMMWMMRGGHSGQAQPDRKAEEEIAALRVEVAALREQTTGRPVGTDSGSRS